MIKDDLLFRKVLITAGAIMASSSLGVLIFEWLGYAVDKPKIAMLAGIAGGIVWQIEKRLLRDKSERNNK